ncbi:ATP-binding protein [Butyricicoccus porcorum]|uniref:FtsK domain-containing protein n=1 Tax=Butyricicoccus porcorum TaxID=1945634 RepID=A0A252F606_9FIRM|nr:FtsK/SpoIIIE domain-containing protein [Butyricicoccus porcorum]OUM21218.1 hypothetical protein CBW42_04090 [Butyricicoccus porcorum]
MARLLNWESVDKTTWSYKQEDKYCTYLAYQLTKLPNFTDHRFLYLCKEVDGRAMEVAKKQFLMIRQFHSLGTKWAISLRLLKANDRITLYLLFRYADVRPISEAELNQSDSRIRNALMNNEYSFRKIDTMAETELCLDTSWATEVAEIIKDEQEYQGDEYPTKSGGHLSFYSPNMWTAADNNMEHICRALINHKGTATVEVTIQPTSYLEAEKQWINVSIGNLKECMNGETLKHPETGKILWRGKKLPILKTPIDNFEKLNKQYETSRIFLTSVRVFAEENAETLAQAFLANSVKNEGRTILFRKPFGKYQYLEECYRYAVASADIHTPYWNRNRNNAPFRAQRLCRIASVEEIANFFRIPIPTRSGFPGFLLDTGLEGSATRKPARSVIRLGNYMDEAGDKKIPAEFDSQQFAKHGLIVGVPGSGKTTAMFNILYQFWAVPEEQRIPFIILEPAKTEYRALKILPEFKDDLLVFTLGDEGVSPFRFNPMEVLPGIKIESHISKLEACFIGAFDLFDPLPLFLDQAIRRTYREKGWYDDSCGGEEGLETPTLSDLCRNAEYIVEHTDFDARMRSDFKASLLERLNSLRRGSKGRMLDTPHSIPMEDLMGRPVVLELDSLNGDEKSLMMMFLLSYVYEYCKVKRKSGSPLKHMLLVEEAHNLIGSQGNSNDSRANPKAQTIELFTNMLAEMRALGQGILIADQLPTAIAQQAVKQTNVKILMRVTAKDDREEIGNTMDLDEEQMHQVVNFKTGHAYLYHEGEDRVRMIRMVDFKGEHDVEEPPSDDELKDMMCLYQQLHSEMYLPYPECSGVCVVCNRRARNQAENFVHQILLEKGADPYMLAFPPADRETFRKTQGIAGVCRLLAKRESMRIRKRYGKLGECFGPCVYIHMLNQASDKLGASTNEKQKTENIEKFKQISK